MLFRLDLYPLLGAAFNSRGEGGTEQWIQVQLELKLTKL